VKRPGDPIPVGELQTIWDKDRAEISRAVAAHEDSLLVDSLRRRYREARASAREMRETAIAWASWSANPGETPQPSGFHWWDFAAKLRALESLPEAQAAVCEMREIAEAWAGYCSDPGESPLPSGFNWWDFAGRLKAVEAFLESSEDRLKTLPKE